MNRSILAAIAAGSILFGISLVENARCYAMAAPVPRDADAAAQQMDNGRNTGGTIHHAKPKHPVAPKVVVPVPQERPVVPEVTSPEPPPTPRKPTWIERTRGAADIWGPWAWGWASFPLQLLLLGAAGMIIFRAGYARYKAKAVPAAA